MAFVFAPQVYAGNEAEVGFCSVSFNVYFLNSSSKTTADKLNFIHPICFTASEHDHVTALPKYGMFVSAKLSGNAISDLEIKVDENGSTNTYRLQDIGEKSFGKIVTAKDGKGGYVELRVIKNAGNYIRIKCIDCKITDIVKALNTLGEIQFINADLLPKEKIITLNFEAISVRLIATILSLEADLDMAQYVRSEKGEDKRGEAVYSATYVERYIFLWKSLKE